MKFAFVRDHRKRWPVGVMCRVLQVSRSGFYAWRRRRPCARARRREQLLVRIRQVHRENRELYGSPRVHRALLIDGERISRNTVNGVGWDHHEFASPDRGSREAHTGEKLSLG